MNWRCLPNAAGGTALAVLWVFALAAGNIHASDRDDLEVGFPVSIEDAFPTKQGTQDLQGYLRFDHVRNDPDGTTRFSIVPRLQIGTIPNGDLSIEIPYRLGNATETSQGDVRIQGVYAFVGNEAAGSALSITAAIDQPFGLDVDGLESELGVLGTQSLGAGDDANRIHLNALWIHNYDPTKNGTQERRDRYKIGVAYSHPVTATLLGVIDVYRETERSPGVATNLAELGLRYVLTQKAIIAAGLGFGFANSSVGFRANVGFQYSLGAP